MLLKRNTFALHKKAVALPIAFFLCFLFIPVFYSHGGEHIVLYRLGTKDPAVWDQWRRYLGAKGYRVSMFDGSDSIEKHIENVNRINKLGASAFIAVDLGVSDQNRAVIAITIAKKGRGNILAIDEIPALYANESRELATSLASMFNKGVKEIPLFPLLGVDMPGLYIKVEYTPDKTSEVLEKFQEGMRRYFRRGKNDER